MKLRQFITWVASAPGIVLATYGFKRQVIAPEEMYFSAVELKRIFDRNEAEIIKERDRELAQIEQLEAKRLEYSKELDEAFQRNMQYVLEENRLLRERNTKLHEFMNQRNLFDTFKKECL